MSSRSLVLVLIAVLVVPAHVQAQFVASVSGRVVGIDTSAGIRNATVELIGHRTVLTTPEGQFRFEDVPLREYVLRVSVLGYAPVSRFVNVQADVVVDVLEIAPLTLDSVIVLAREIDFEWSRPGSLQGRGCHGCAGSY